MFEPERQNIGTSCKMVHFSDNDISITHPALLVSNSILSLSKCLSSSDLEN